jgi:hypothetical protein
VQAAWDDFRAAHGLVEQLRRIDDHSTFFEKLHDARIDASHRKPAQDVNIGFSPRPIPGPLPSPVARSPPSTVRCLSDKCAARTAQQPMRETKDASLGHRGVVGVDAAALSRIRQHYEREVARVSDINEHLPTLRLYASRVGSVVEMGVRTVVSTWAFLLGLSESAAPERRMIGVDLQPCDYEPPTQAGAAIGVQLEFRRGDSASISLPPRDLLFIDTWHVYAHLRRELAAHHATTRRYIILHDTEVDGIHGEAIRGQMDTAALARASGYDRVEIERGLLPAVEEFLRDRGGEWQLERQDRHNNGLMVLVRSS